VCCSVLHCVAVCCSALSPAGEDVSVLICERIDFAAQLHNFLTGVLICERIDFAAQLHNFLTGKLYTYISVCYCVAVCCRLQAGKGPAWAPHHSCLYFTSQLHEFQKQNCQLTVRFGM